MSNSKILREANLKLQKVYKQRKAEENQENYKEIFDKKVSMADKLISNKVYNESAKRKGLDSAIVERLIKISSALSEGKIDNSLFNVNELVENSTQTESNQIKQLESKVKQLEEENESLKAEKVNFIQQTEVLKSKVNLLSQEIEDKEHIIENKTHEIESIRKSLDKVRDENLDLISKREDTERKLESLEKINEEYTKLKNLVKDNYGLSSMNRRSTFGRQSNLFDRRTSVLDSKQNDNNIIYSNEPIIVKFFKLQLMKNIVKYLTVDDIANLKLVNTVFFDSIDSDLILSNDFFMKVIKRKNDRIVQLSVENNERSSNISEIYNVNNEYIEGLITK